MRKILLVAVAVACVCPSGCATSNATGPEPGLEAELSRFEAKTPEIVRGERIYTTQQAVYIADLVLAMQGIDMQGRQHKVSFFEGVYLVTFSPGPGDPTGAYTVQIAAEDSEVLSVRLIGRVPAPRPHTPS